VEVIDRLKLFKLEKSVLSAGKFALEMCLAAGNRQKIHKTSILAFKVIQGH